MKKNKKRLRTKFSKIREGYDNIALGNQVKKETFNEFMDNSRKIIQTNQKEDECKK